MTSAPSFIRRKILFENSQKVVLTSPEKWISLGLNGGKW